VSPASKKMDYLLKLLKYRSAGVKEYWIVDPEKNRVIVYNFTGDESVNDYTLQDFVKVGIYEDFVIDFGSMEL
jgi:Uma2 family endonuclease